MSLQIALVAIGLILLIAVYLISVWLEKKSGKPKTARTSPRSGKKNEPSIVGTDHHGPDIDDIPVLETPESESQLAEGHIDVNETDSEQPNRDLDTQHEPSDFSEDDNGDSNRDDGHAIAEHLTGQNTEADRESHPDEDPGEHSTSQEVHETLDPFRDFEDGDDNNEESEFVEATDRYADSETDDAEDTTERWVFEDDSENKTKSEAGKDPDSDDAKKIESLLQSAQGAIDSDYEVETEIIDWDDLIQRDTDIDEGEQEADSDFPTLDSPVVEMNETTESETDNSADKATEEIVETTTSEIAQPFDYVDDQQVEETESLDNSGQGENKDTDTTDRIEPRLVILDDAEFAELNGKPQQNDDDDYQKEADSAAKTSTGMFVYPKIPGFDKISQIDYWVKIHGERDVGRESVLAQYRESRSALSKSSHIHGLKIPEKSWCNLENEHEDARFGDLIVTLQLADQNGPVDQGELMQFADLISKLSEGTGRSFSFMAPIESALQQANALSEFVRYYESVFVVNIKPEREDSFDGNTINRCATQLGLERNENNYYDRNKSVGKGKVCLYSLANMSDTGEFDFENLKGLTTRGVTFFTKPAINRSPGAAFAEMADTAKAFAGRIKGEAIAANREDLSQDDVDQIRQTIEKVAREMEDQGMAPGSDEAMRVF